MLRYQLDSKRLCTTRITFVANSYIFCSNNTAIHYSYSQLHTQLASQLYCTTRITSLAIRDQPIMLLFYPLCYAAVLLKFTYYAQEQQFLSDYYAFMYGSSLYVADNFIQSVLLECINENTSMLYYMMTVLLEYIDRLLQFSIKFMLNIAINICFTLPYYVSIVLNTFNHPVCSK